MILYTAPERAVLGAVLLGRGILLGLTWDPLRMAIDAGCASDLFSEPGNRLIWDVIVWLEEKKDPVDIVTITNRLHQLHQLDHVGGFPYVSALAGDCPSAANVVAYVEALRDATALRVALEHAQVIQEAANTPGANVAALIASVEEGAGRIAKAHAATDRAEPLDMATLMAVAAEEDARRDEGLDAPVPPMTGLLNINTILLTLGETGHRAGIAGRPSMGKTQLCLQVLIFIALNRGPVMFISRESPAATIARRIFKTEKEMRGLGSAVRLMGKLEGRFFIVGPGQAKTILDARSAIRAQHEKTPLRAIAADYLSKFDKHTSCGREDLDLGEISKVWADLVEEMGCLGIMLSQMNRQVAGRPDKEPQLTDIRECGSFEEDCDSMLMLHRPGYFTGDTSDARAFVFVRKQRDGGTGKAILRFKPGHWFENGQKDGW